MFRKSTGRERCNSHADLIPAGEWLWSGDNVLGVFWCEAAARAALRKIRTGDELGWRPVTPLDFTPEALKSFPAVARVIAREHEPPPRDRWLADPDADGDAIEPEIEDI